MKAIALTGSIGSGKTAVLKFVRKFHVPTIDCDALVAKLYRDKRVQQKLLRLFQTKSKKEIAAIVFSSPSKRRKLEKLLHPLVWREAQAKLASFRKQGKPLVIVDVPLLFEVKWQKRFNSTIFVKAPKKLCIQRLKKRGFSIKEALQRWNSQMPLKKKVKKAHHVIDNSGSLSKTGKQVKQLLAELR